jgi:hypothetical protein
MVNLSKPEPDLGLLRKVLDIIDAEPEHWDQRWFEENWDSIVVGFLASQGKCGTTRCVAGWVDFLILGKVTQGSEFAQEKLGLLDAEADALFYKTSRYLNAADQRSAVQRVCERIAARAGERL